MRLKDIVKDLKVGDVFWMRIKVEDLGDQSVSVEDRHFGFGEACGMSSMLGAPVYGEPEVVLGELPFKEVVNERANGMVEAYEKILLSKKITIE